MAWSWSKLSLDESFAGNLNMSVFSERMTYKEKKMLEMSLIEFITADSKYFLCLLCMVVVMVISISDRHLDVQR